MSQTDITICVATAAVAIAIETTSYRLHYDSLW